ncbi:MAG: bscD [Herminiimonas sp.]|nr:bscD [Herminiimonas sp.]
MSPDPTPSVELRVLYGPQAGSRMTLAAGEYLLGTSDQCTIILAGPRVEDEHAILTIDGEEASIQPLDGTLSDAQGTDYSEPVELTLGIPVELGGIWISVDRPEAEWPDPQSIVPQPGAPAVAAAYDAETAEAGEAVESSDPETVEEAFVPPPQKSRIVPVVTALVAITISGVALAGWFARDKGGPAEQVVAVAAPVPPPKPQAPATITEFLKTLAAGNTLTVTRDDTGDWLVGGYVPTHAAKQALIEGLAAISPPSVVHVTVEEEMVAAANRFLATRASGGKAVLRAEAGGAGALRLAGAASDPAILNAITQELMAEVPGLRRVENNVAFAEQLRERLKERIAAAGLATQLVYLQEGPEVMLSGKLSSEETARWEMVLVQFTRDYGSVVPIRASIGSVTQRLPVGVQIIVSGPVPYIVTSRGDRVNQGGAIDGLTLVSVRDGEVVFEGKKRVRIVR